MADVGILGIGALGLLGLVIAARHSIKVIIECFQDSSEGSVITKILKLDDPKLAAFLLHFALLAAMIWTLIAIGQRIALGP